MHHLFQTLSLGQNKKITTQSDDIFSLHFGSDQPTNEWPNDITIGLPSVLVIEDSFP